MPRLSAATLAPLTALIAVTLFSMNDVLMKLFSDGYALHQIVLVRSIMGFVLTVLVMAPLAGGFHLLRTKRLGVHMARAACVFFANMMFFLGLAGLPLADAVALFFVSPFIITIFSVIFLGETVGPRRWIAVALGMLGVLIVLRPGTSAFQVASLFPIAAAFGYAGLHILTRYMRDTENAVSMTFYIQVMFLGMSGVLGLWMGDGRFETDTPEALVFLVRPWVIPEVSHILMMLVLGVFASVGGYCISQAYRLGEAALVAPFEYLALPLGVLWGILVFGEWPDVIAWLGIGLILASGLYTVWRENKVLKDEMEAKNLRT
ncbi:DMT family transporter [uncultured Litoreibacter sp.]|uniref:DMT family transporter n=1 Tax=uncultured Litoreibacter sp. TaxID=1392394 RepID=UPI002606F46F|nr:DMT family transporter [uncultured Litoreibacter sp.]